MAVESNPVGHSQSNGIVERAIESAVGQMRVLSDALETRLKVKVGAKHLAMPWLVEYAATLIGSKKGAKEN